jgi:hypothetical protein
MLSRAIDWALPEDNPFGVVYGLTTIGVLLAAESSLHDTYPETIGSAVVAIGLYWLAHAYSNLLGRRLTTRRRLTASMLLRALRHDWAIMRGAGLPLLALVAAWLAGAPQETAVAIAVWVCAGSLVVLELLAGVRARSTPSELMLEGSVGAAMGLSIVALRVILH